MQWRQVEDPRDMRPGECAKDAGGCDEDRNQGQGSRRHAKGCLGEENGDAGHGGDRI